MVLDLLLILSLGVLLAACAMPDRPTPGARTWTWRHLRHPRVQRPLRRRRSASRQASASRHGPALRGWSPTSAVSDAEWEALVRRIRASDDLDVD